MADVAAPSTGGLSTRGRQPLIGIPLGDGPDDAVQYFTSEDEADRVLAEDPANRDLALSAIGSWTDIDFDEMLDELDRIRHARPPTPPAPIHR